MMVNCPLLPALEAAAARPHGELICRSTSTSKSTTTQPETGVLFGGLANARVLLATAARFLQDLMPIHCRPVLQPAVNTLSPRVLGLILASLLVTTVITIQGTSHGTAAARRNNQAPQPVAAAAAAAAVFRPALSSDWRRRPVP